MIVFCYMFMCFSCFGLVVSTCQVIGYRKTPLMTPSWGEEIISTKPRWKSVFVCIFLLFGLFMLLCGSPQPYTIYISYARYSLYVLKVPLNTKQANKQTCCSFEPVWCSIWYADQPNSFCNKPRNSFPCERYSISSEVVAVQCDLHVSQYGGSVWR